MTLAVTWNLKAHVVEQASLDARVSSVVGDFLSQFSITDGTGAAQAQKTFTPATAPAIAQSVNTDYDLSGTLGGSYGNVVFTAVKGILIIAGAANPGILTLFGGTNPFLAGLTGTTPAVQLAAGQHFSWTKLDAAGWAVTNTSNDNFRIGTAATVGTYTWKLLVVGI